MNNSLFGIMIAVLFHCNIPPQTNKSFSLLTPVTPVSEPVDIPLSIGDIPAPLGYERIPVSNGSFENYLRKQKLKKDKTVYLYNGQKKLNQSVQYAVLDISVGTRDLQQCADAVMRLRAEYLKEQEKPVCFADNNGKQYCWAHYKNKGWQAYLETVFGMCGTLSLEKQLKPRQWKDLQIGDVIIKGGSPGHAVLVADVVVNKQNGQKLFLLAQSYMPAQDIHLLLNLNDKNISPWYRVPYDEIFDTPEWTFSAKNLKSW